MTLTNKYRSAMDKIVVTPEAEERILRNISGKKEPGIVTKKQLNLKCIGYAGIAAACCAIIACAMFIYPSFINLNRGQQLPQAVDSTLKTAVGTENHHEQAPESVDSSAKTAVQSGKQQEQTQKSVGNSGKTGSQTDKHQEHVPKSAGSSSGTTIQPGKQNDQPSASDSSAGETATQTEDQLFLSCNPIVETKGVDELKKAVDFELLIPGKLPAGYKIDSTSVIVKKIAQIIYSEVNNKITYRVSKGSEDISGDNTSYDNSEVIKVNDTQVLLKGNNSSINLVTWIKNGCSYSLSFSMGADKTIVVSIVEGIR